MGWFLSAVANSVWQSWRMIPKFGMWTYFLTIPNLGLVLEVETGLLRQVVQVAGQEGCRGAFHRMLGVGLSAVPYRSKRVDLWA